MKLDPPPPPPHGITSFRDFREHLREAYERNGRSVWTPGFQAVANHRLGTYLPNIPTMVLRLPARLLYRFMRIITRNVYGIELDARTVVGRRLRIAHQHGIVIHGKAVIGDDCLIRQGVTIGAASNARRGAPVVGDRVEFGAGAIVAGPVRIGDGAIISPGAVVMTNVPPGSIVAGPPSRIVTPPPRKPAVAEPQPSDDMPKADQKEAL
jgi:serine O-acetyltransferase